jgi:tRNA splicing ligase
VFGVWSNRFALFNFVNHFIVDFKSAETFSLKDIEAFLIKCHYDQELFELDGDLIKKIEFGWELCDEILIGPTRPAIRNSTPAHKYAHVVRKILRNNQKNLKMDSYNKALRDISAVELFD